MNTRIDDLDLTVASEIVEDTRGITRCGLMDNAPTGAVLTLASRLAAICGKTTDTYSSCWDPDRAAAELDLLAAIRKVRDTEPACSPEIESRHDSQQAEWLRECSSLWCACRRYLAERLPREVLATQASARDNARRRSEIAAQITRLQMDLAAIPA